MKKKKQSYLILSGLFVLIIILVSGIIFLQQKKAPTYDVTKVTAKKSEVKKWTADERPLQPKEQAVKQIKEALEDSSMDEDLIDYLKKGIKTVVIPGLRGGWSIDPKTGEAAFGNDWVPQGVTQSKSHYYVSAYDGDKKLNSVIYQMEKKTGKYLKTLILPSKAHVGGIAYDHQRDRLLYSDDVQGKGGIGYISKEQIDTYDASETKAPIEATYIEWALGRRTSAITLYDNQLVVAKYGKNANDRSIVAVPLNEEGLPNKITRKEMDDAALDSGALTVNDLMKYMIKKGMINSTNPGWNRLQGVTIARNGLTILSQSNGNNYSKIWFQMPEDKGWSKLSFTPINGAKFITLTNSAEEVSLSEDGSSLATVFESGAKKYREEKILGKYPEIMDRVVILPMDKLSIGAADR